MNGITQIKTILSYSETKFKEKSSIFLGFAYPVKSIEDVTGKLALVRKKYFDATHHCYAYKLANNILKYSDDGEPSGTAGIRILNVIEHFNLVNILLVVGQARAERVGGERFWRDAHQAPPPRPLSR